MKDKQKRILKLLMFIIIQIAILNIFFNIIINNIQINGVTENDTQGIVIINLFNGKYAFTYNNK